jgi:hypothetical protein
MQSIIGSIVATNAALSVLRLRIDNIIGDMRLSESRHTFISQSSVASFYASLVDFCPSSCKNYFAVCFRPYHAKLIHSKGWSGLPKSLNLFNKSILQVGPYVKDDLFSDFPF